MSKAVDACAVIWFVAVIALMIGVALLSPLWWWIRVFSAAGAVMAAVILVCFVRDVLAPSWRQR